MVPTLFALACSDGPAQPAEARRAPLAIAVLTIVLGLGLGLGGCTHGRAGGGAEGPSSLLEISGEGDADVWVDGQYIGQVSAVSGRLELAPGVHRVEVRKPGHFPVQRTVRVDKKGGGTVLVTAELLQDPR